ncbi:hypothetical protein [Glycomyces tenuis]|uniref:hypothetical protein n=1 Tax=Glycomyces tenuis TaxID=58116 RepID=UPI00041C59F4|nr:hypothetical protein [Glycomyces tenuis]
MSADAPTLFDHLPPAEDSPATEPHQAWEDMSPEERKRAARAGVLAAQEMMAEWYALRAELAGQDDAGTDTTDLREGPSVTSPPLAAERQARKSADDCTNWCAPRPEGQSCWCT